MYVYTHTHTHTHICMSYTWKLQGLFWRGYVHGLESASGSSPGCDVTSLWLRRGASPCASCRPLWNQIIVTVNRPFGIYYAPDAVLSTSRIFDGRCSQQPCEVTSVISTCKRGKRADLPAVTCGKCRGQGICRLCLRGPCRLESEAVTAWCPSIAAWHGARSGQLPLPASAVPARTAAPTPGLPPRSPCKRCPAGGWTARIPVRAALVSGSSALIDSLSDSSPLWRQAALRLRFPGGSDWRESAWRAGDLGAPSSWEDPLETGMATAAFLPGEFCEQQSLAGCSPWGRWHFQFSVEVFTGYWA